MRALRLGADPDGVASAGGPTIVMQASATALKIGDVVFVTTTAKRVDKSVTQTDAKKFAGVVVGGGSTFGADPALFDSANTGLQAVSGAGKSVVLQVEGIANVVAGAPIAAGDNLTFDTGVAGRVLNGAGAVAGQIIGIALTAATAAGQTIQMLITRR